MTFSAKKPQTHENLSSALQKTFHFIRKKHFSCFWAFTPKIAFSNIFSLREKFLSIRGLATSSFALNTELVFLEAIKKWFCAIKLIICTKHRIGVLRSYKEGFCAIKLWNDFLQKAQTHENLSSTLQKAFHFIRKKHFSCFWAFTPKIAFSNFFSLRRKFLSIRGLATSSFALNTELVFLEAIKKWFCAINLIICTEHRIGVLRSYKEVILCN